MKTFYFILLLMVFSSCAPSHDRSSQSEPAAKPKTITETSLIVLGTLQDGGSPHIACKKDCCRDLFENPDKNRKVVSLGLVDPKNNAKYLFEATPDMPEQMKKLKAFCSANSIETPNGIFLTHAHIGHYTGLMYLGKEAMNAQKANVFAMPVMKRFLEKNGPWNQLVSNQNISIQELSDKNPIILSSDLKVIPFKVPHRDEYSETVGYTISGPNKKVLFIPDIDKWEKWDRNIIAEISEVDYAFIDATFYDGDELNNRPISEIPHPFIIESMALFANLSSKEKSKIYFIHLNHTNPALNPESAQTKHILENGFNIARIYDVFKL